MTMTKESSGRPGDARDQDAQQQLATATAMLEVYAQRLAAVTHENIALSVRLAQAESLLAEATAAASEPGPDA